MTEMPRYVYMFFPASPVCQACEESDSRVVQVILDQQGETGPQARFLCDACFIELRELTMNPPDPKEAN